MAVQQSFDVTPEATLDITLVSKHSSILKNMQQNLF